MSEDQGPNASGPRLKLTPTEQEAPLTASQELMRNAIKPEVLPLADGRKLHVRKPGVLADFRLIEALGPELAANQTYAQMCQPLKYLGQIEHPEAGTRSVAYENKLQIEGLIQELGEEGMDALIMWYFVNVQAPMQAAFDGARREAEKAALKNG